MALQGVLSWLSIYFVREMNLQLSLAATLISVLALISAFGYPLGGTIMDKWYQYDKRARVYLPAICVSLATVSFLAGFQPHNSQYGLSCSNAGTSSLLV